MSQYIILYVTVCYTLQGVVNGVNAVIQSMTQRKSGHIINMSSDAGRRVSEMLYY